MLESIKPQDITECKRAQGIQSAAAVATAISYIAQMAMFASMFGGGRDDEDRPNPLAMLLMTFSAWAYAIATAFHRVRTIIVEREALTDWVGRAIDPAGPGTERAQ